MYKISTELCPEKQDDHQGKHSRRWCAIVRAWRFLVGVRLQMLGVICYLLLALFGVVEKLKLVE